MTGPGTVRIAGRTARQETLLPGRDGFTVRNTIQPLGGTDFDDAATIRKVD